MGSKHVNIPIFIPHLGCPNNCVLCNQHTISGHGEFELARARREIDEALSTIGEGVPTEIAFFRRLVHGDRPRADDSSARACRGIRKGRESERDKALNAP